MILAGFGCCDKDLQQFAPYRSCGLFWRMWVGFNRFARVLGNLQDIALRLDQHLSLLQMHDNSASQIEFGQVTIAGINLKQRDDIPAGLQALYADEEIRQKLFEILKRRVRPQVDHNRGRPGMDLWRIFVLGVIKRALDCDRLQSLACSYLELRQTSRPLGCL